jgi:hypothetical protein
LLIEHMAGLLLAMQHPAMSNAIKDSLVKRCETIEEYSGGPVDVAELQAWHAVLAARMRVLIERIEVVEQSARSQLDPL